MRKVAEEVEQDVFVLLQADPIAALISGGIYRQGMRPFNSKSEDIVVSFLTGLDGQKQTGIVNINCYVPDIDNGQQLLVKNVGRCKTLAIALNTFKEELMTNDLALDRSGYKFLPGDSMLTTYEQEEIDQHFINMRLKFEYLTI